ncbi:MAG: hypothetical protein ACREUX_05780 [Burkholderiales bacterium]
MKIVEHNRDRLVIEAGDARFAWLLAALCAGSAVWAAAICIQRPSAIGSERVLGLIAGSGIFLAAFLALFERARFVFDRRARSLQWRRRRALGTRAGSVPFEQIRAVLAQVTVSGKSGTHPKWRLALGLDREHLPVSVAYVPDGSAYTLSLSETVRRFIGLPVADPFVARIQAALQNGDRAEAVRLLHEERHVSPAAAERFVAELAQAHD